MTRDEILQLKGRELDAAVRRALGFPWHGAGLGLPYYSTDIAAAWQVVERMHYNHWKLTLEYVPSKEWWYAAFDMIGRVGGSTGTAPLAICRAALLAVMEMA